MAQRFPGQKKPLECLPKFARKANTMTEYSDDTSVAQDADDRLWGTIAHLSTLIPLPLFNLLGPWIVMITKGDESYFVKRQAIAAINFQITVFIAYLICIPFVLIFIGIPMMWVVGMASMILTFIAGIKAYGGISYQYPMSMRFLS